MSEEQKELMFDLLSKKAVYGLDDAEQIELDRFDPELTDSEFRSLEMATAAVSMVGYDNEELPPHLIAKIAADAEKHLAPAGSHAAEPWPPTYTASDVFAEKPTRSWFGWLGWAVAAAACAALAINIALTRFTPNETAKTDIPAISQPVLSPLEKREQFLQTTTSITKADWTVASPTDGKPISGDIVWSTEKQTGYVRLRGLPVNDTAKSTYQLWIFDKSQDKATPIDGGTFDVTATGEVVIPITAKLKALGPEMFAITIEKPGGVVVSKRNNIAAIAKVEL